MFGLLKKTSMPSREAALEGRAQPSRPPRRISSTAGR